MKRTRIILLILAFCASAWAGWEGYSYLARSLADSARSTDRRRVAVFGFASETGDKTRASAIVTERLTNEIAGSPNLEVIERSRLDEVLKEQKLSAGGAVDNVTVKRIGNILGADAVITGTVIELDDKNVEVNARLVDTQDAHILKAVTRTVKKDWEEKKKDAWGELGFDMDIKLDTPMPLLPDGFLDDETCRKLSGEEKSFVLMCVELRARRTAHDLKTGAMDLAQVTKNPGSEIKNQDLKHHFYSKIKEWYYSPQLRALTSEEESLMVQGEPLIARYPCR